MYDKQEVIDELHDCGYLVERFCDEGDLDVARLWCDKALKTYRKARVEFTSNISDRSEREKAISLSQGYITRTVGRLLRAYGQQSDIENALTLYRDALEDFKTATDKEVREAAFASSQADGFWELVERFKRFGVDEQHEGWFLERLACLCYGVILLGSCLARQYEESASWKLRHRMEAAEQLKPAEAFAIFVQVYKTLGKTYEDEGLQESALAFHEIDDVWKLNAEVEKLAETYKDKELRRQFLCAIATSSSESILYYGKAGKGDEARAAYGELKNLVKAHKEEDLDELAFAHAKGAANLVYMLVTADQPDEARMVYHELRKLAEEYPENSNLLERQVGCRASEIIYAYAKANRFDEAQEVYHELRKLAEDHPRKRKLLAWQANGAFSLTYEYFKTGVK